MNERTVQQLLDAEWHNVIAEQLAIYPMPELVIEPGVLGQYMAELGQPCEARKWYTSPSDIEAFIVAYDDTTALWAEIIGAKNDEVPAERSWMDEELQDLIDGIAEAEWNRRGC